MEVTITARNLELGDALRDYVESKVDRLERYMPDLHEARVELSNLSTKNPEDSQVAQVTIFGARGSVLRSEERTGDMRSSIDAALDKMSRQIRRFKGKNWRSQGRRAAEELAMRQEEMEDELDAQELVRVKRFRTRPMTADEAIDQMELLGHDFFVFYSVTEGGFNVVYRRRDGGYGLLVPELS